MNKVQYRTRGNVADPWSEWRETVNLQGDVYFPRGTYVDFRIARVYAAGDRYVGGLNGTYEVLDAAVWISKMNGVKTERLACRVEYMTGDHEYRFVSIKDLDGFKEMD